MEFRCAGCQAILRVDDQYLGQQTRCPKCQTIQRVESDQDRQRQASTTGAATSAESGQGGGNSNEDPMPLTGSAGPFFDERARRDAAMAEVGANDDSRFVPVSPADWADRLEQTFQRPHRAKLNLVLGILGLLITCPLLSLAAWVLSSKDLQAMRENRMDPSGRELTRTAYFLGLIGSLFWITMTFCITLYLLISSGS